MHGSGAAIMSDLALHITAHSNRSDLENMRDALLELNGVVAAACRDEQPQLVIINYDPDQVSAERIFEVAQNHGFQSRLISMSWRQHNMNYEYIDDLAIELQINRSLLDKVIEQLGIETHCIGVPPSELNVAIAINSSDAQRLRDYTNANIH
jgi:hypothetical protein